MPRLFGAQRARQGQGVLSVQTQFLGGGKIGAARQAGKIDDQRPARQFCSSARGSTGAGIVLMTASNSGSSLGRAVRARRGSPHTGRWRAARHCGQPQ